MVLCSSKKNPELEMLGVFHLQVVKEKIRCDSNKIEAWSCRILKGAR